MPVARTSWLRTLNLSANYGGHWRNAASAGQPYGPAPVLTRHPTKPFFRGIGQIHFPITSSQYQDGTPESRQVFSTGIRFVIRFEKLSPFRLLDEMVAKQ